jgi:hypothetical protein
MDCDSVKWFHVVRHGVDFVNTVTKFYVCEIRLTERLLAYSWNRLS